MYVSTVKAMVPAPNQAQICHLGTFGLGGGRSSKPIGGLSGQPNCLLLGICLGPAHLGCFSVSFLLVKIAPTVIPRNPPMSAPAAGTHSGAVYTATTKQGGHLPLGSLRLTGLLSE